MDEIDPFEAAKEEFKADLLVTAPLVIVQNRITTGDCAAITSAQYGSLRSRIADHFGLQPTTDVKVVGSAKLGFSISPRKRFRLFGETSDIDVAIISPEFYRKMWGQISEYIQSGGGWERKTEFLDYKIHGWIRPDKLPNSADLPLADEWFEFFRELTRTGVCGDYTIKAGLYYDIDFLESYQLRSVSLCIPVERK